jgi:3-phosphoshikimate 1-carboxyvinyltransferase
MTGPRPPAGANSTPQEAEPRPPVGDWPAPTARGPLAARVTIPGSKSLTNRELVLAALADAPGLVLAPLAARDSDLMVAGLQALGIAIDESPGGLRVQPGRLRGPASIDTGLAGTVMRFLPPVAALAEGSVTFDGDEAARARPMGAVLRALSGVGVSVDDGGRGRLPVTIHGTGSVVGGRVEIDASASSQFVSALLLAGARYEQGIDVVHIGKPIPSLPHIAMTVEALRARGVSVDDGEPNRWHVSPGPISARDVVIEPDLSNAAPFLAAALVVGGQVTITGWPARTTQPGGQLPWLLQALGGQAMSTDGTLTITGTGRIPGADLDLHEVGELTPVIAAVAAFADGPTRLRGIAHLRHHETDRLAALAAELRRVGVPADETTDGLSIRPTGDVLVPARLSTYGDHRMVHAAALLGLRTPGTVIVDVGTVAKTLPTFCALWTSMLGIEGDPQVALGSGPASTAGSA